MPGQESVQQPHIPLHTQRSEATDKAKQQKELQRRIKSLRMDFALTFSTPEGQRVLKWLLNECGFHKSQVGGNPALGMDVAMGTVYNSARESIYIEMRQLIPHEVLKKVEYENVEDELI